LKEKKKFSPLNPTKSFWAAVLKQTRQFLLHHINLNVHPTKFLKPHSAPVFFVLKKGIGVRCRGS